MISADTIPLITDESNTDYSRLRNDGLAMLQQLAGSIWTDYNEHDPGVTILEELCYVLTELNYLSQQPIQNLLTLKDGTFPAASNAFYTAATILHNSPLIVNDYRKLIADRLPEVSNVWVYPYYLKNRDENSPEYGVSGLYRVVVDLNVGELPLTGLNTHPVKDLLKHYRNMGELFPVVTYLQQEALSLSGSVYVDDATRIDDILAKMLVVVEDYLKPGIPFYTLEELMEEGYPVEKIFEGPKLRSGFVKDEDLVDQVTEVYADNLLKLILSDGAGASNVADLRVVDADGTEYMYFSVADGTSVYLDKMATLEKITVICRGITVQVRKRTVMLRYNEYRTQRNVQRSLRQTKQATDLPIPQGKYLNPESYYSIQNEFPGIYGTGEQRLPIDATEDRKARTLQLKAFLLFFEQLLADYRSQVEHMHQLFSSHPQEKTYFYQPLYNVPDVAPLLKGYPGKAEDIYASDHKNSYALDTKTYLQNPNPYTEGLADLYAMNDDFGDRREMFLQHLLARFNFAPFLFSDSENTQNDLVSVPAELNLCEELLRLLPAITMNRGRASEYDSNAGMASGLEQLVHCLSGIFNEHYAAYGNSEELCLQLGDSETDGPLFKETRSHRVHVVINPVHPDFFAGPLCRPANF